MVVPETFVALLLLVVNCFHGLSALPNSSVIVKRTAHHVTDRHLGNAAGHNDSADKAYSAFVVTAGARAIAISDLKHASLKRETAGTEVRQRAREDCDGQETTCNHLICESPKCPTYGGIKENRRRYKAGSIIHYYCNSGFSLSGVKWNRCQASCSWKYDTPTCKSK